MSLSILLLFASPIFLNLLKSLFHVNFQNLFFILCRLILNLLFRLLLCLPLIFMIYVKWNLSPFMMLFFQLTRLMLFKRSCLHFLLIKLGMLYHFHLLEFLLAINGYYESNVMLMVRRHKARLVAK